MRICDTSQMLKNYKVKKVRFSEPEIATQQQEGLANSQGRAEEGLAFKMVQNSYVRKQESDIHS